MAYEAIIDLPIKRPSVQVSTEGLLIGMQLAIAIWQSGNWQPDNWQPGV